MMLIDLPNATLRVDTNFSPFIPDLYSYSLWKTIVGCSLAEVVKRIVPLFVPTSHCHLPRQCVLTRSSYSCLCLVLAPVVETGSGMSSIMSCLIAGRRPSFPTRPSTPESTFLLPPGMERHPFPLIILIYYTHLLDFSKVISLVLPKQDILSCSQHASRDLV